MPDTHRPRSGSMQFWPRKRAKKLYSRVRGWASSKDAKPMAFMGYKVGMTHVMGLDNYKNSMTKGQTVPFPVTIIECPPLKVVSLRGYKREGFNLEVSNEVFLGNSKSLAKKLNVSKPKKLDSFNPDEYDDVTILLHTQPELTGIGKKKPEVFEVHLGGSNSDKVTFVKEHLDKDIKFSDLFEEGDLVDIHSITKGHGTQGPVKRFGIGLKHHKSEKGRRRPGSLGGWSGQQHFMYRIAMSGQTGYQKRVQYNAQILKIGDDPTEVNAKGGFKKYGVVKNQYILLKGSVGGPAKRQITLTKATRPGMRKEIPTIQYISTSSRLGR